MTESKDEPTGTCSGDDAAKGKAEPHEATLKNGADANGARDQPLVPGTVLRSERQGKVTVKANLARDLSIFLGFIAVMAIFSITTLKDVGKPSEEDLKRAGDKTRKARRKTPGASVREAVKDALSKIKVASSATMVDKESICDLYLAESSIPEAGMGVFSARSFDKGDVVIGPGRVLPIFTTIGGVLKGRSFISEHGMIIKPHPKLFNVEGGHISCEQESCDHNADSDALVLRSTSSAFVATRAISPGDEIFMSFPSHAEEDVESYQALFATVPTAESYELADIIIADEENGLTTVKAVSGGRRAKIAKGGKQITRTVEGKSLQVLKKTVSRFDYRAASLLPDNPYEMFQGSVHGSAFASMKNRTVNWLIDDNNGACFDGIQSSTITTENSGRGAIAKRNARKGEVIMSAPLYVVGSGTGDSPSSGINHCFSYDDMSFLLCPLSRANVINHRSTVQQPGTAGMPSGECEDGPNARYNWSTWNPANNDVHEIDKEDVLKKHQLGLSFDVILTRDVQKGEEIFIDFGLNARENNDESDTFKHPIRLRDEVVPERWKSEA